MRYAKEGELFKSQKDITFVEKVERNKNLRILICDSFYLSSDSSETFHSHRTCKYIPGKLKLKFL